jgi:hypothetical protein
VRQSEADILRELGIVMEDAPKPRRAARKKRAKKKATKKKTSKKKPPARKKTSKKKATRKKERVDRWREGSLYQARDYRFHPEDHELLTPATIDLDQARAFVAKHHYLKGLPKNIRFVYGLYHKPSRKLVGVAAFGSPAYDTVLSEKRFPGFTKKELDQVGSELVRLVLLDEVPRNGESWFMGAAFKDMREREQRAVVSFSDPAVGHVGTIYKSLEAAYTGRSKKGKGWRFKATGTPVSANDISKLKAACPVHRPVYKRKLTRVRREVAKLNLKTKAAEKEVKRLMRGDCGSGKSISGWEGAIRRWEGQGAPAYMEGTCLGEWRDMVLPMIAVPEEREGKHRYIWELPLTKGLPRRLQRKAMRETREKMAGRSLAFPCGVCQSTDHKTTECPGFDWSIAPPWLRRTNPHIRSSITPCGKKPKAIGAHYVERRGSPPAVLLLDLNNVNQYGPELFYENLCPLLAGFKHGDTRVQREGVSWKGIPVHAESYELHDLAARVGLPLARVESMLVKEGRAWARSKVKSNPPPWAERLMGKYWKQLESAVGPARMPAGPGAEEFGCGHYGCVWPTASGQVVKITSDQTEASFVAANLRMGGVGGMVRYYQILQLAGASHRRRPVYVIWRAEAWEVGRLIPPNDDPYKARKVHEAYTHLDSFKMHASKIREFLKGRQRRRGDAVDVGRIAWDMHKTQPSWGRGWLVIEPTLDKNFRSRKLLFNEAASDYLKGPEKIAAHLAGCALLAQTMSSGVEYMTGVGQALDECLDRGILLCDVHGGNIGRVEYDPENWPGDLTWGITDPGHALFLTPEWGDLSVPELAAVASNPWGWW